MKIAIVTATYPPYHGGTGNVCRSHARELAQLGHEVHIWTAARKRKNADADHAITVHILKPLLTIGNGFLLPQLLWRLRRFDIIHWHYPFFGGEIVALAAKLTRTPLVVTYHQDVILGGLLGKVAAVMEGTLGRWALQSADLTLFTSHDYAQHSKVRRFLAAEKVDTLPNGVDLARFIAPSITTPLPQHDAPFIALLVAGLDAAHYFKGVTQFLNAIAKVKGIQGVIVGSGNLREQYELEAQQLDIGSRVTFAGRVSDAELPAQYHQASVTVLPSTTMGEAFGLVLVESLASGTPVIASSLPGVRTVVADQVDGFLVQPNDVVDLAEKLRMMRDLSAEARQQMGMAGRQKVKRLYGWKEIGRNLANTYKRLIEETA
ncbi:MAG: glycosyltransferase family 4 protein [Candidatus Promineifilaceae bacterium]